MLGIDDRKGDIKVGLDADLVIWTNHPFAVGAAAEHVFIEGQAAF